MCVNTQELVQEAVKSEIGKKKKIASLEVNLRTILKPAAVGVPPTALLAGNANNSRRNIGNYLYFQSINIHFNFMVPI